MGAMNELLNPEVIGDLAERLSAVAPTGTSARSRRSRRLSWRR
jgi:hypothetical protein